MDGINPLNNDAAASKSNINQEEKFSSSFTIGDVTMSKEYV